MAYIVTVEEKRFKVDLQREGEKFIVYTDSDPIEVTVAEAGSRSHLSLIAGNRSYDVTIEDGGLVSVDGEVFRKRVEDERALQISQLRRRSQRVVEESIAAPMPGLVVEVEVKPGDRVKEGEGLVVIEAMKMQNELKAPREGQIKKVLAKKGVPVNGGDTLVVIG